MYGLFSATQGLPVSHTILCDDDSVVASFKDRLLGLGRLAATVSSSTPRSGVFSFNVLSKDFVGLKLDQPASFFVLLHIADHSYNELVLKCLQIGHILQVLYRELLEVLGARIERDLAAAMNSASFAGSGQDDDCDEYYDDRFSIVEDHYIRPLLHVPRVSALYASPIHHCLQIQSLLNPQTRCGLPPRRHHFSFALYKLFPDECDDFEVPLVELDQHHTLQFDHCSDFRVLLRFYRSLFMAEHGPLRRSESDHSEIEDPDLKSLLSYSAVFLWDSNGQHDKSTAVIVSATQNEGLFVAMSVPAEWVDVTEPPSSDHFLARVPSSPAYLPRAGVSILPLTCLGRGTQLAECWTAVLGRLLLYLPPSVPSTNSTGAVIESSSEVEASGIVHSDDDGSCTLSVEQVASLLLPTAPSPGSLGCLHPQPPLAPSSDDNTADNLNGRPKLRPSPNILRTAPATGGQDRSSSS